jgi:hypothetical protein
MSRIRALTLHAGLVALTLPMGAMADDYRAEVGLSAHRAEFDDGFSDELDVLGVDGTYYFSPVVTDGLPLAEAAFLNRSSFVGASAARSELDDEKIDVFGAGIGYYLPNTIFYGELNVTHADDFGGDETFVSGALGVTPIDGLLVTTRFDEDGWDPNVSAKYVGRLPNSHFYAASIDLFDASGDLEWGAGFDYFLDTTFSAGLSVSDNYTQFRAEKFFTPRFSLSGYVNFGDDDAGDQYGARVAWRF